LHPHMKRHARHTLTNNRLFPAGYFFAILYNQTGFLFSNHSNLFRIL